MLASRIISEGGLKIRDSGVDVEIRLPWYRSLPLSTVEIGEVLLDGQPVARPSISFELNGKTHRLDRLADRYDDWWYVLDSGFLHIADQDLKRGSRHEVNVSVGLRPPYIPGFYRLYGCKKRLCAV
ncbi:MAG TPA: DUF6379 domain-containing protein [Patescibacteria group bacterium]|nr:DUF6379 domain-containing protein [Patescibacteria group bacterium]